MEKKNELLLCNGFSINQGKKNLISGDTDELRAQIAHIKSSLGALLSFYCMSLCVLSILFF